MKILVVGSGGREHAIAWRLAQDPQEHEIYCAPGNAGTLDVATNVDIGAEDVGLIAEWAENEKPDLVVVGPEAPLVKGLVDRLEEIGIPAFGPVAAGAKMEGSKRFAKEIMDAAGVPTGKAETFTDADAAKAALPGYGLPVVIKADGLAAGKGVIVAETLEQARAAVDDMLVGNRFGAAGAEVLIEEFLHGEETLCASLGQGLLVWYACKKRDEGMSLADLTAWCEEYRYKLCHWFTVDDLMYLKRGGRVSAATALLGTMLQIKPVLHVDEGHLINVSKARGRKASIDALVTKMEQTQLPGENDTVFICHGDCMSDAEYLAAQVKEKLGVKDVFLYYVGAVIGSHSGPGTLALFFLGEHR